MYIIMQNCFTVEFQIKQTCYWIFSEELFENIGKILYLLMALTCVIHCWIKF